MKISYIAPVVAAATPTPDEMGWIEEAIHNAIQTAIVIPFQTWALNMWNGFMGVSHYICLFTAVGGVIFCICGIEKGKKVAIIASLTYVGLQILNWFIVG